MNKENLDEEEQPGQVQSAWEKEWEEEKQD